LKLRPKQVVLICQGQELLEGQSLSELLGDSNEAKISVLQQPCQLRHSEYESYVDKSTPGFLPVDEICFPFTHPLVYPNGEPGTPDRTNRSRPHYWRKRGAAEFPEPQGIKINMMPFRMGDKSSLPEDLWHYWPMIEECDVPREEKGKIGYLTIHESQVAAGETQRRPGLHIESPGALQSGGSYEKNRYNWGCGIVRHDRSRVEGGIYMAHNIAGSCSLWNVQIKDPEVAAGKLGDMEHMRDVLGEGEDMKPGKIYWLTDATPHESRPVTEDCYRQFFRLVTSSLSAWYPEHCTANALVELDPTTKIVHGSKFE